MRLAKNVRPPNGFIFTKFKYHQGLIEAIKQYPGTKWNKENSCWVIPQCLQGKVLDDAHVRGIIPAFVYAEAFDVDISEINPILFKEYQQPAVLRALSQRRLLICFETGLGKAATAIETCRLDKAENILVVTQRGIVGAWEDEFKKWAPDIKALVTINSYSSFGHDPEPYDAVIFDEIQNLKNWKTDRYKTAKDVLKFTTPNALVLGLSATPIDKPEEIHSVMEIIRPGAFGWWTKFRERYCETRTDVFGGREVTKVVGLKQETTEELRQRISCYAVFASKKEFAHLLPAFNVKQRRVPRGDRVEYTLDWLQEHDASAETKFAIITYNIELVSKIEEKVRKEYPDYAVYAVTGQTHNIDETIKKAIAADKCILVASMKSIGTGIDLTAFPNALVVQLYWSLNVMKQLLGRFSRLSGKLPSSVELLTIGGTPDEIVASAVVRKIGAVNALLASGQTDEKLVSALDEEDDEENLQAELRVAFSNFEEEYE